MTNTIFDFVLLGFSLTGWAFFVHEKLKINAAFIPIFIFSGITSVLFFSGLLNIMPHMVILIFLCGLLFSMFYIYLFFKKSNTLKSFFTPSVMFFVLFSLVLTFLLKGVQLLHYDNFSHWGLIVKEMFRIDGLPDDTTMIEFRNYPPGSAVFIYYVGKILGPGESHSLMAQGYLLSACLATLFVFSDWKKPLTILLPLVGSITFLSIIPGNIFDLLVDTLLGITAAASFTIAFYYKNDLKMSFIVNLPVFILLILIKDSGKIFFAYMIIFILLLLFYSNKNERFDQKFTNENLYFLAGLFFTPLFIDFLWRRYVKKAYPAVAYENNKFALSLEKFTTINKSEDFIQKLGPQIIDASIDVNNKSFLLLLLLTILLLVFVLILFFFTRKLNKVLVVSIILSTLYYIIYIFFLYLMYLYLMPEGEAAYLAGFNRYQPTMITFCLGILLISFLYEYQRKSGKNITRVFHVSFVILMLFVFFIPMKDQIIHSFSRPDFETAIRLKVHKAYKKIYRFGKDGPKVLYYSPDSKNDYGYLRYVLNYEQLNKNYYVVYSADTEEERENIVTLLRESEYIVVLKHDTNINDLITEFSEEPIQTDVYKIENEDEMISLKPI